MGRRARWLRYRTYSAACRIPLCRSPAAHRLIPGASFTVQLSSMQLTAASVRLTALAPKAPTLLDGLPGLPSLGGTADKLPAAGSHPQSRRKGTPASRIPQRLFPRPCRQISLRISGRILGARGVWRKPSGGELHVTNSVAASALRGAITIARESGQTASLNSAGKALGQLGT